MLILEAAYFGSDGLKDTFGIGFKFDATKFHCILMFKADS